MKRTSFVSRCRDLCLVALVSITGCFQASCVSAESSVNEAAEQPLTLEQRAQINYDAYIMARRRCTIELLDLARAKRLLADELISATPTTLL